MMMRVALSALVLVVWACGDRSTRVVKLPADPPGRNRIVAQRSGPDSQPGLTPVIPCVDLSGKYMLQGEDGQVFVTIDQTGCQRIAIDWGGSVEHHEKSDKHDLALDGEFHDDADWFGMQGRQSTSATFVGWGIQLVGKPTSTADTFLWKHNLDPLPNGDLCSRFLDPHLQGWANSRLQRSSARDAPRDVPARPEPECR